MKDEVKALAVETATRGCIRPQEKGVREMIKNWMMQTAQIVKYHKPVGSTSQNKVNPWKMMKLKPWGYGDMFYKVLFIQRGVFRNFKTFRSCNLNLSPADLLEIVIFQIVWMTSHLELGWHQDHDFQFHVREFLSKVTTIREWSEAVPWTSPNSFLLPLKTPGTRYFTFYFRIVFDFSTRF